MDGKDIGRGMAGYLHAIVWYTTIMATSINVVLFWLQLRTYRRIGHRSLALLGVSTMFGLASAALLIATIAHPGSREALLTTYSIVAVFTTAQGVIGVWGASSLFGAFEALSRQKSSSSET